MPNSFFRIIVALFVTFASVSIANAGVVFNNTATDTGFTQVYSSLGVTQIGDTVTLGGTDRFLSSATVQFFDDAAAGTFAATLRFYNVGAPVGAQIGSAYTVTGQSIAANGIANVTFFGLSLTVPNNVVFTVQVSNVTGGADLGLNVFDPPTVGSASNSTFIDSIDGTTFATRNAAAGQGNFYLQLNTVPEPSALAIAALGLGLGFFATLRKKRRGVNA